MRLGLGRFCLVQAGLGAVVSAFERDPATVQPLDESGRRTPSCHAQDVDGRVLFRRLARLLVGGRDHVWMPLLEARLVREQALSPRRAGSAVELLREQVECQLEGRASLGTVRVAAPEARELAVGGYVDVADGHELGLALLHGSLLHLAALLDQVERSGEVIAVGVVTLLIPVLAHPDHAVEVALAADRVGNRAFSLVVVTSLERLGDLDGVGIDLRLILLRRLDDERADVAHTGEDARAERQTDARDRREDFAPGREGLEDFRELTLSFRLGFLQTQELRVGRLGVRMSLLESVDPLAGTLGLEELSARELKEPIAAPDAIPHGLLAAVLVGHEQTRLHVLRAHDVEGARLGLEQVDEELGVVVLVAFAPVTCLLEQVGRDAPDLHVAAFAVLADVAREDRAGSAERHRDAIAGLDALERRGDLGDGRPALLLVEVLLALVHLRRLILRRLRPLLVVWRQTTHVLVQVRLAPAHRVATEQEVHFGFLLVELEGKGLARDGLDPDLGRARLLVGLLEDAGTDTDQTIEKLCIHVDLFLHCCIHLGFTPDDLPDGGRI